MAEEREAEKSGTVGRAYFSGDGDACGPRGDGTDGT